MGRRKEQGRFAISSERRFCKAFFISTNKNMTTEKIKYDARANQQVWLELTKGNKTFEVAHELQSLSDERYFLLVKELNENGKKTSLSTTDIYEPKHRLWNELVVKRIGYGERPDWKEKANKLDCVQAVNALLIVTPDLSAEKTEELFIEDEVTPIKLQCLFNRQRLDLIHNFSEASKEEFDEYLAILNNEPQKNVLASAKKKLAEERMVELYDSLNPQTEDYVDGIVPAWHKMTAVQAFLSAQFTQLGKF